MSAVFLDENIGQRLRAALAEAGTDVLLAVSLGAGAADAEVLAESVRRRRILITRDRDYGELIFRDDQKAFGVIYIRHRVDEEVAAEVLAALAEAPGRYITLDRAGMRSRALPI